MHGVAQIYCFSSVIRRAPGSPLFPYTTLFRSELGGVTTVSLVQGECLGGGFEAALSSDVIIAERNSRFGFPEILDRKSTRLNSSHSSISYAVLCLKKKTL